MFVRLGQIAREAADIPPQHLGDGAQFIEGRITLAPLHAADVASVRVRFESELLLRQPLDLAGFANPMTQQLE